LVYLEDTNKLGSLNVFSKFGLFHIIIQE